VITMGSLDSWRDFIDVRDIARAVVAVAQKMPSSGLVLNVGGGEAVQCRYLVQSLAAIAGYYGDIVASDCRSARSAEVDWQCADVSAIQGMLGWSAEYSIEDSLAELWSEVHKSRENADG
jgi:NDP-hexose 4-ketoreductase